MTRGVSQLEDVLVLLPQWEDLINQGQSPGPSRLYETNNPSKSTQKAYTILKMNQSGRTKLNTMVQITSNSKNDSNELKLYDIKRY